MTAKDRALSLLNLYARIAKDAGKTEELGIWNTLIEQCKEENETETNKTMKRNNENILPDVQIAIKGEGKDAIYSVHIDNMPLMGVVSLRLLPEWIIEAYINACEITTGRKWKDKECEAIRNSLLQSDHRNPHTQLLKEGGGE